MEQIELKGSIHHSTCEITDVLNTFNKPMNSAREFYICAYSPNTLVIRAFGATRGCIHFNDDGIITEIIIYELASAGFCENMFSLDDGPKILEEMNKFIGRKIR